MTKFRNIQKRNFKKSDIKKFLAENTAKKKVNFTNKVRAVELANCYKIWYNCSFNCKTFFHVFDNEKFYTILRSTGELSISVGGQTFFVGRSFRFKKFTTKYIG